MSIERIKLSKTKKTANSNYDLQTMGGICKDCLANWLYFGFGETILLHKCKHRVTQSTIMPNCSSTQFRFLLDFFLTV